MDWVASFLRDEERAPSLDVEATLVHTLRHDPDGIVRHEAAFVLGELYSRGAICGDRAISALCHAARHDRSVVARHESAEALSVFSLPLATETLTALLTDPIPDVVATARIALARHSTDRTPA